MSSTETRLLFYTNRQFPRFTFLTSLTWLITVDLSPTTPAVDVTAARVKVIFGRLCPSDPRRPVYRWCSMNEKAFNSGFRLKGTLAWPLNTYAASFLVLLFSYSLSFTNSFSSSVLCFYPTICTLRTAPALLCFLFTESAHWILCFFNYVCLTFL